MQAVEDKMKGLLLELMKLSYLKDHYLVGGTNLALRYNHRTSIDLDLFVERDFDEDVSFNLNKKLKKSFGARYESLSISAVGVFGYIDGIKVDLLNYPFKTLLEIEIFEGARLASPLDIGAMKIKAIIGRGSRKDFYDLHQLIQEYPLLEIMQAYQKKYFVDHIGQAKMALTYFVDAEDNAKRDNQFVSISNISWETIKKDVPKAINQLETDIVVQLAVKFHNENNYMDKKTADVKKALAVAFNEKFGKSLTKSELERTIKIISQSQSNDGASI